LKDSLANAPVAGEHTVTVTDANKKKREAKLAVKHKRVTVNPPKNGKGNLEPITLSVVQAYEMNPPEGEDGIEWLLLTNLGVDSFEDAVQILDWYSGRWQIEVFFKTLKSGCKAEKSQLLTFEGLSNQLAFFIVATWRLFYMTYLSRENPDAPATAVFTPDEADFLKEVHAGMKMKVRLSAGDMPSIRDCVLIIACLGGYMARKHDRPPGSLILWRGFMRFADMYQTYELFKSKAKGKACKCG
jgi:hypothetical protein